MKYLQTITTISVQIANFICVITVSKKKKREININ